MYINFPAAPQIQGENLLMSSGFIDWALLGGV